MSRAEIIGRILRMAGVAVSLLAPRMVDPLPGRGVVMGVKLKLSRFRGAGQAFNGGFSDAQDASALFT